MKRAWIAAALYCLGLGAAMAQDTKPLATRELDVQGVVAEVTESKREDGMLTVRVRFRNTGDKPATVTLAPNYNENYIVAGKMKYHIVRDTNNRLVATPAYQTYLKATIKRGETWNWWAKFPAPPPDMKKYSLYLKVGPPIDNIPIVDEK